MPIPRQPKRKTEQEEYAEVQRELALLKRHQKALEARERFMTFVKFTSPDPEDPNDVERSRYKNARHHDAIARVIEEVEKGEIPFLILTMPPRHGKEIADSVPVLTTDGWTTHGNLKPGDQVFGVDGKPTTVLAVAEPNTEKMRVEFSDGASVVCHPNHEWAVYDRSRRIWRVMETREMAARALWVGPVGKRGGRGVLQLPDVSALQFPEKSLPLHPYALGVWLGDGCQGTGRIDMAASDFAVWRRIEALGYQISSESPHSDTGVVRVHFGTGKPGVRGPLTEALFQAGVLDRKHIPEAYLRASDEQRMQLLAGLMDTDGHVEAKTGRCRIVTTEPAMVEGLLDLCGTLGFRPYVSQQEPALSSSGIQGRKVVYTVGFQPDRALPTSLPRRQVTKFAVRRAVSVRAVTSAPPESGRCIQVDRCDGVYLVGRELIPTHNSELVSRRLPAWYIGRHPDQNVVVATYNDDFAMDFGKDVRSIMQAATFRQVFPSVGLRKGGTASDRLQTTQGGLLTFVGRGGTLTGRGAHLLIIDDIISNAEQARSQTIRDQTWDWFTKVAMSRRMGKKLVIITFTRWHSDDIIGRLTDPENPHYNRKLAEKIKIINLPALAEDDDPLGRPPGTPLWPDGPDKFDEDFLNEQMMLDPLGFASLYQQRPSLLDGDMFRRENIKFYRREQLPDNLRIYCASDHAVATGQRNDSTVLLKVGLDADSNIWLIDCFWSKVKADAAVEAMLTMARDRPPLLWWAEKGHISKSIGPFLRKRMIETNVYINLREVTPANDKATRAQSIAARVAMGKVYFPSDAVWSEKAVNELMAFPNGTHDDFVDAFAYIGLGMQSQFAPARNSGRKQGEPAFGTLDWVKQMDRWAKEKRARAEAGGF